MSSAALATPAAPGSTKQFYSALDRLSRKSLAFFLDNLVINSSPTPRAWGTIREPWQEEILRHKIPLFEGLAGIAPMPRGPRFFCDILPRGHDKSSLEGRLSLWLLRYSKRIIEGYVLAADKDQGDLLLQAMKDEAALNPWAARGITFNKSDVTGPAGKIEVIPADAGSAFGFRGNYYILDEFTNWWKPAAAKMFDAVSSGFAKMNPTIVGVLSNAGFRGTWQHDVLLRWKKSPLWRVYEAPGPMASWMDAATIADLAANMASKAEARRVFGNQWISAGEDLDYLSEEEVAACFDTGDNPVMYRLRGSSRITNYVVAIDYGPKKDRTVCLVGHRDSGTGRAIVDRMDVWDRPCKPSEVWAWVEDVRKGFTVREWVVDPYQMSGVIEDMQDAGLEVHEYLSRGGKGNVEIAQYLRAAVAQRVLLLYPGAGLNLVEELSQLICRRMGYGYRIDHLSTKHDDQAVTLGMFLVRSAEHLA